MLTAGPASVSAACCATVEAVKGSPVDLRPPLPAMTARPAPQLPDPQHSDGYTFEPKLDGWRCLAFHRLDGAIALQSRQHKPLTAYFPDLTAAVLAQVPPGTVLDGELVDLPRRAL